MLKIQVPRVVSWRITLVWCAPHPHHYHHLQWYSTNLVLYLLCLHQLLDLHQQCSILTIIIASQIKHVLMQQGLSQLITQPSVVRNHSKDRFSIYQIFLSILHSTCYNLLSLLPKHWTDCPSHSLSWMPLLYLKLSTSFLPTPLWDSTQPAPIPMSNSCFLGQRRSSSIPGSQLLLRGFISGWQCKIIRFLLEFLLRGTGWSIELTLPRIDYDQLPTVAILAFWRSTASSIFQHSIPQLKLLKACFVGIQWCIFYFSSWRFSCSSTEYLVAMFVLMKPWLYSQAGLFTLERCQTGQLFKNISFSA